MSIHEKLLAVQNELKAPKGLYNSFGKYRYRSCEGILEAVKPLLKKYGLVLTLSDELTECAGEPFIRAIATVTDSEEGQKTVTAYAQIAREKKGMDVSQITGTASSYARKYALNGLFLIDDTKDADTDEYTGTVEKKAEKISKTKAEVLRKSCEDYADLGCQQDKVLQHFGVESFEQMTEQQFLECVQMFNVYERRRK